MALAEQPKELLLLMLVLGLMLAATAKAGAVLSMVMLALEVALPPLLSLTEAVQVRSALGMELLAVTSRLALVESKLPLLSVHAKVGVRLPSS